MRCGSRLLPVVCIGVDQMLHVNMNVDVRHTPVPAGSSNDHDTSSNTATAPLSTIEWDQFIDELLPDAPDSSKFTKLDFVSPSFVVDSFIEKRKDEPLDHLRQLLTTYANRIRAASVSIINEDYADLMHLSSNVIGVGKSVDKVLRPLTDAHDDVLAARNELSLLIQSLEEKLNRLRQVRRMKSDIEKMMRLDGRLQDLGDRLQKAPALDPVASLIAIERLKADLLEVERTLQSISSKSKLLFSQKDRFSQLVFELQRIRLK